MTALMDVVSPANGRTPRPLLEVEDLRAHFFVNEGVLKAVDGVSFTVHP